MKTLPTAVPPIWTTGSTEVFKTGTWRAALREGIWALLAPVGVMSIWSPSRTETLPALPKLRAPGLARQAANRSLTLLNGESLLTTMTIGLSESCDTGTKSFSALYRKFNCMAG